MTVRPRLLTPLAVVVASTFAFTSTSSAHPEACAGNEKDAATTALSSAFSTGSTWLFAPDDGEFCFSQQQTATFDDSAAQLETGEQASRNMTLLANLPKSGPMAGDTNYNSDIAFQGDYAYQGNYNGFQVTDISDPRNPEIVSQVLCPGAQNDISVYGDLLVTSTDSTRNFAECRRGTDENPIANVPVPTTSPADQSWEGIRIFDVSDPENPRYVAAVETPCGSHTHTLVPDDKNDRLVAYVSSYNPSASFPKCQPPHDLISVVAIPTEAPQDSSVLSTPVLFPDGGNPGDGDTRATAGCHDITAYPKKDLAAGACMGQGILMNIKDPANPIVLDSVEDDDNMAFWHSATFTDDAKSVIFTDELGGGGAATCNPTIGDTRGANTLYTIKKDRFQEQVSYFKIPRTQKNSENCVAHNGMFLPTKGKTLLYLQAWYQGGTSVVDYTDPTAPREVAFFERGPFKDQPITGSSLAGAWSSYYYRGHVFVNDIQTGLDVLSIDGFDDLKKDKPNKKDRLNAQLQTK